jgi:hypothetical protein
MHKIKQYTLVLINALIILSFFGCNKAAPKKLSEKSGEGIGEIPTIKDPEKASETLEDRIKNAKTSEDRTKVVEELKKLVKDYDEPNQKPVTQKMLDELLSSGFIDSAQYNDLINIGYDAGNPLLFMRSAEQIPYDKYSLNFLWINARKVDQGHLFGTDDEALRKNLIDPITEWRTKQPGATINFWYDGNMVNSDTIANTIKKINESNSSLKINFKNIRDIELVKKFPHVFDAINPVYFRVDLAKALIADHELESGLEFAVNIDSDINAITLAQMFDVKTLKDSDILGITFGRAGANALENSIIFLRDKGKADHLKDVIMPILNDSQPGIAFPAEAVFNKYPYFATASVLKKYGVYPYKYFGKFMLVPKTRHDVLGRGFSDEKIARLKPYIY